MMRVLVADKLPEHALVEMRALGCDVRYEPGLDAQGLAGALEGVGVLVVRGMGVTGDAIRAADSLNLIVRAGAGVTAIDVETASARGIYVANCPGKNSAAVAELTLTLIGSLDRRVPAADQSLKSGKWEKNEYAKARGLRGRRLGIAGLGQIGQRVLGLARAYEMELHAFSRSLSRTRAENFGVVPHASLAALAGAVEILTLHLDLTPRTEGIVDREVLDALPDGAFLVNTARAELIDWDALAEIAPKKKLRLGLDVVPDEPNVREADYGHSLVRSPWVVATPHIGASTDEAQDAVADEVVRILRAFLREGDVPNVVNVCATSPARYQLVVRHTDRLGVLADVLSVVKRHGINIEEMENTVFDGAQAASAKISLTSRPSESCLAEIRAVADEVLHVDLVALPNLA